MQQPEWNSRWERLARVLCPFVVAGCLMAMMPPASRVALDPGMKDVQFPRAPESIIALIAASAAQYGLDPALLQAVIKVESNFNSDAVSSKGAIGLMQLMPLTATALHVLDPFDPKDNIRAGAALLRRLLNRFDGDLTLALAAYHVGEARVRQAIGVPALPATQLYVERVLGHYNRFRTEAHGAATESGSRDPAGRPFFFSPSHR
ncbi:MAG: lytic transglycosylase domain-containing protein [Nitrospira sp.]|jgi:soluble lytic murein transglycosylase-like protein|nr:lytic transglycosylase domain-containing protein [Nitrospira sp.]